MTPTRKETVMAVEEWHLGCAYHTPDGTVLCRAIYPGGVKLERTVVTGSGDLAPGTVFEVKLDDPDIHEGYCFINGIAAP